VFLNDRIGKGVMSVSTSMKRKSVNFYGCKIGNKKVPKRLVRLIQKFVGNPILCVPRRKKGLTSSGRVLCCHPNVERLVKMKGGKHLFGYEIQCGFGLTRAERKIHTVLVFHSVWVTPEGLAVDVTKKENDKEFTHDQHETLFVPLDSSWESCANKNHPLVTISWDKIDSEFSFVSTTGQVSKLKGDNAFNLTMQDLEPTYSVPSIERDCVSWFSIPSMRSGKTDLEQFQELKFAA